MAPRARPGSRAQVLVVVDAGPNPGQLQGFEIVYQDRGHLYGLRARQRIHVG
ncbi:MAG TPA: hypothetical protein VFJ85_03625 [Acidimicrobiales bacterium]|nr:hypothetical protein [Acidimicrobiales bacterium]